MPESPRIPFQNVLPALYASIAIFIVEGLLHGYFLFNMDLPDQEHAFYLALGINWAVSLVFSLALHFSVLCQMQRHLRMGPPRRPLVLAALFALLSIGSSLLWMVLNRYALGHLMELFWSAGHNELGYVVQIGMGTAFSLGSLLVCAGVATLAGGKGNPSLPGASAAASWIVQALTLSCGLYLIVEIVINIANFSGGGLDLESSVVQALVTSVLPLGVTLAMGIAIYACWPARLRHTAGWALYLLGTFMAFLAMVPPAAFAAVEFVLHWGRDLGWVSFAVWPLYALCLVLIATLIGGFFRTRKTPAGAPANL